MAPKTIYCHLCGAALQESTIKRHISSIHLDYRPYHCSICKENGDIYKTASENAMHAHIATAHNATNAGYFVCKVPLKEHDLKAATVECLRLSALQLSERSATGNKTGNAISVQERNDESQTVISKKALLRNSTKSMPSVSYARILHFKPQYALDKKPNLAPKTELDQNPIAAKKSIPGQKPKPAQKTELVQKMTAAKKPIPAPKTIAFPKLILAQKTILAKISIVICIDRGYAKFVTSEGKKFPIDLLSNHLPILRQSKALKECETHIAFEPCRAKQSDPRTAREKFEKFLQEIHSIAHLWAKRSVVAEFHKYPEHANKVLALADFCDGLFGRDRSILACKRLEISLVDSWPFSVVTNFAPSKKLILKEMKYEKQQLHFTLLDAIYEKKIPQHVHVELFLYRDKSTTEFNEELKKRFRLSTGLDFELIVLSPRIIPSMVNRNKYGTIEIESGIPQSGEARYIAIITQRSFSPGLGQHSI